MRACYMCGIAGILRFDDAPIQRGRLDRMAAQMAWRGPDGHGVEVGDRCGLAHTRLAVLDAQGGTQPMRAPGCATCTELRVVFNGEIYNHRALREELTDAGQRFSSNHSDTEVLLHGYRKWGDALPQRLEGMFALAIWDPQEQVLFLARDRAGKKPLYLHEGPEELCFASTPAALLAALPQRPPLRRAALSAYLAYGYTYGPTLLEGVRELAPAHALLVRGRASGAPSPYWTMGASAPQEAEAAHASSTEQLLRQAVSRRLEADVPLGCFLSGGLDSSLVAALAQDSLRETGGRLRTFSVSMPDARYDEGPWARRVAEHIGSDHTELRAEPNLEEDLKTLVASCGEPLGDSSWLPTYWISRAAREHVTVALSGDGGDEVFGGYDRYRAMRILKRHAWWLRLVPPWFHGSDPKSFGSRAGRLLAAARARDEAARYASMVRLFSDEQLGALGVEAAGPLEGWERLEDPADAARRWDFTHYLPGDLLRKVDRASMAVGLEVRSPLLDTTVVEMGLIDTFPTLPKPRLRQVATMFLPREIVHRPKMGFAIPLGAWFAGNQKPMLQEWLLEGPLGQLGLHRSRLEALITDHAAGRCDHAPRLFALLSLAIWLNWLQKDGCHLF